MRVWLLFGEGERVGDLGGRAGGTSKVEVEGEVEREFEEGEGDRESEEDEDECCVECRFFLAAAALILLRSSVPRPSALQRACSRVVSCSSFR